MKRIILLVLSVCIGILVKAQENTYTLQVSSEQGIGVQGATIDLLNTHFQTSTDASGKFLIRNIPAGRYTIQVSALGYATTTRDVILSDRAEPATIRIREENKQLGEVVVTAQKREENVQKVPLSVSVLSAKEVRDYRLWNNEELSAIIPNLYSANPGDNRNVTSIRGIATTSYDQTVATYIDGVSQFGLDTYIGRLQDVERIEVLRGPQGTLYGRNAMGGVINIITKQPTNELKGFAEIGFGNYGQQRYNVGVRAPLIENKLFLGVAGLYTKSDGYYTNTFTDSKFDKQHAFMGNYYLKFLANEHLSFTLNVKHNANRNHGTFPLAYDMLETPFKVNQNAVTKMIDNVFNSSLSIRYFGEGFNFTSQSAYQSNHRYYTEPIDGDFSPVDAYSIINNYGNQWNNVKVGTQEFRFSSPASTESTLQWVVGSYLYYRDNPVRQGIQGMELGDMTMITTNVGRDFGLAFFGDVTYKIHPKLDFSIGLRYDNEHKKLQVAGEMLNGQESIVIRPDTSSSASFNAFSPKASLAYHISEINHLYATYNRGFRSGGITQYSGEEGKPPLYPYEAEYSNNMEVGSKNTFLDNRLRVNVSAFYTLVNDAQVPTLILPDAITITKNAGKLTSKGMELELTSTPFANVEATYNFGYTHARYTDLYMATEEGEANLTGNHQVFTPDVTSLLALQYGYNVSKQKNLRLTIRGEWKYLGPQYFDLANQIMQEGYSLLNVRVGAVMRKIELSLWANNIADKTYIDYAYDFGAAHLGNPQTYGISILKRF